MQQPIRVARGKPRVPFGTDLVDAEENCRDAEGVNRSTEERILHGPIQRIVPLPAVGMGEIPGQLALHLSPNVVRINITAGSIEDSMSFSHRASDYLHESSLLPRRPRSTANWSATGTPPTVEASLAFIMLPPGRRSKNRFLVPSRVPSRLADEWRRQ